MAKEKFEKALAEWPYTKILKDGGVHVFGKYEQPGFAQSMAGFWFFFCFVLFFVAMMGAQNAIAAVVAVVIAAFAYPIVVRPTLVSMFGKNVDVKIYPDKIQVRDGYRYRSYSREMPIEFRVEEHHKGLEERAKEIKYNKRVKPVYREAIEAVMQYGEKRVPLAELPVKEIEKGKALVIRLQNMCATLDDAVRRMAAGQIKPAGEPAPTGPGDFGPAPKVR
jgi:hypothetical protein